MMVKFFFKMADRNPDQDDPHQTVDGHRMVVVGQQVKSRKGRFRHVYHMEGSGLVYWNRSRNGIIFYPMARTAENMVRYYDVFVKPPLTEKEKAWLKRNKYTLLMERED